MPGGIGPARLTRSWRASLLAAALLLSVVSAAGCTGSSATTARGPAIPADVVSDCLLPPASCDAPHLFQVEYGIQPLLDRGIDGRGETVTVLALATSPGTPSPSAPSPSGLVTPPPGAFPAATDIRQDLAAFDSMFRLAAARIQVVSTLAGPGSPWEAAGDEIQDTEIVHAVAPAATLRVILLPSSVADGAATATAGLLAGLRLAVSGTDAAVISFSLGEHYFTRAQVARVHSILLGADDRHVTVIAGSGDDGEFSNAAFGGMAVKEVSLPASDPLVLAAGGTSLTGEPASPGYIGETAWNGEAGLVLSSGASGGGFSHLYARPAYQVGVRGISTMRGVPDVAGEADEKDGWAFVFTSGGKKSIIQASGTSASASLWGGLMALADQYSRHDLGFANPAIYRIARSSRYHHAFHDITTGSNIVNAPPVGTAGYQAGPGWDPVTGWGSPDAQLLVSLLAA